jgi:hypothetical protein
MYYSEHEPPHFHAKYAGDEAVLKIDDLSILVGSLPPRALGLTIEWAALHRSELLENWNRARNSEELQAIEPLR